MNKRCSRCNFSTSVYSQYKLLFDDADRENFIATTDVIDHIQPLDHLSEAGVVAVEVLRVHSIETDEEL